jgi:hypothetical protein
MRAKMVQKLREILLTRYIGAILVALLCWQALVVLIERVVQTLFWVINDQRDHSALGSRYSAFPWDSLVFSAVSIALFLLAAYALARWLYPADPQPLTQIHGEDEPSTEQPEQS